MVSDVGTLLSAAPRRAPLWPVLLLCGAFLATGCAWLDHFGLTFDEFETFDAADQCWELLSGTRSGFSDAHLIPGYYFVLDTVRGILVHSVAKGADPVLVHHAFHLLLSTGSLALLYLLAFEISGHVRIAAFSAGALALMPSFIGHSQNNPKDLPLVFGFLATFWLLARATRRARTATTVLAALALGVTLNSGTLSVFLAPLFVLWLVGRWPRLAAERWRRLVAMFVGGAAVGFLSWPWLWDQPIRKLQLVFGRIQSELQADFIVLHLGQVHRWTEVPWHYLPVHLLVSMPLPLLVLASCGGAALLAWRGRNPRLSDVAWTGAVWIGALLAAEQLAPARYDGLRHFLMLLPGVALLAGAGTEWLTGALERRLAGWRPPALRRLATATPWLLASALLCADIARLHPYESAYLNPVANALGGPQTQEWLEVEFWGAAYKEGAEWIARNAEPEARVYAPLGEQQARHYLVRPVRAEGSLADFQDASRASYLLVNTRVVWYTPLVRHVEALYEPVHAIRRQRATLFEIYANRGPRRSPPAPLRKGGLERLAERHRAATGDGG